MDRIPVLRMGRTLLVTVQVEIDDVLAANLEDDLNAAVAASHAHGVLIDISGLDLVDSFIGRTLAGIAQSARLLGAETVVVGMRPAVAITLVELGLELVGVRTALNVERGLELLEALADGANGLPAA